MVFFVHIEEWVHWIINRFKLNIKKRSLYNQKNDIVYEPYNKSNILQLPFKSAAYDLHITSIYFHFYG